MFIEILLCMLCVSTVVNAWLIWKQKPLLRKVRYFMREDKPRYDDLFDDLDLRCSRQRKAIKKLIYDRSESNKRIYKLELELYQLQGHTYQGVSDDNLTDSSDSDW